jgi:hypothetical protein
MPGEVIDRPNPQPLPSHIPDSVLELSVKLEKVALSDVDLKGLEEFRRASNYIAAGEFRTPLYNLAIATNIQALLQLCANLNSYDLLER